AFAGQLPVPARVMLAVVASGLYLNQWWLRLIRVDTLAPPQNVVFVDWTTAIAASMAVVLALGKDIVRHALEHAWLPWVGLVSYILYLTHVIVLIMVFRVLSTLQLPLFLVVPTVPALALLVAGPSQRLLEAPCQRAGRVLAARLVAPIVVARTKPSVVELAP